MKTITTKAASAAIATLAAIAAHGVVITSDPLGHSDGTPVAGTTATAVSATATAVLDVRATTSAELDGWTLSTTPPATILIIR